MKCIVQILILISLFLVSCQTDEVKITPTSTPNPNLTPIFPTKNVTPEFQESTTYIELPEWIKKSYLDHLFSLPYKDKSDGSSSNYFFVNSDNGETFIINLEKWFYYSYWKDYDHIVFFHGVGCNKSPEFISILNVRTGMYQLFLGKDYPEYFSDCFYNNENELVRLNREYNEFAVEYLDPVTGEVSLLTNREDGITDISIELSPNKNFVAIVQYTGDFEHSQFWVPEYGNQISIYEIKTKMMILQFQEEQGVLSEVSFVDGSNLIYIRDNTPCVINILSLSKKCIYKIPNQFPDATIILSKNSHERTDTFGFIYFSLNEGGYCFYNFANGNLDCPTDKFSIFKGQRIINYSLSPFDHYLLLEYDSEGCPVPYCDNFNRPKLVLIDLNDNEIFELGFSDDFFIHPFLRPIQPTSWQPKY